MKRVRVKVNLPWLKQDTRFYTIVDMNGWRTYVSCNGEEILVSNKLSTLKIIEYNEN